MASTQLERIAVKRKAVQTFTIPSVPRLPEWFIRQFKLDDWTADMEHWRRNAQESIRAALEAIKSDES